MSYAMEDQAAEAMPPMMAEGTALGPAIGTSREFRIARSGARPLRFSGSELAMAMSYTPELPYWYEINIYRTAEKDFAVAIRLFHQSEDTKDTVEAWQCPSLEHALDLIESYDAAQDVMVGSAMETIGQPAAELAATAAHLKAKIAAARQHYQGLVGEIMAELDVA
ncbi:MAG: hypothetical protein AAFQ79_11580 [Pseudomonadota bacterium]